ncbi:MAG: ribonuclease J, partial [Pseudomonadota bacterium]
DSLLFIPLGGAGEIGLNLNVFQLDGKYLIVDFGAGFADDYFPGINMLVPDITFLEEHKDDILGIVITHAHEDHQGAVQYLWPRLGCPIYTTSFTANFIRTKVERYSMAKSIKLVEVNPNQRLSLGPFELDFMPLTHSTLEMHGLMIRTRHGNLFHTGDWKFDHNPVIGNAADMGKLAEYGKEGVLAVIGDSTNIFSQGFSGSEGDLAESLTQLIGKCKQLVCVTTFASNVHRIQALADAAHKCGRRVGMLGTSLWRFVNAARASGYLKDYEFLSDNEIKKCPRDRLLIISTGCQGEPLASTFKLASDAHPVIKLKPGDTMIFSSKIIPGNDKSIFRIFNKLIELGIDVMTEKDHFVHVSGHPSRDELAKMYELLKPEMVIPVHGEIMHMHEHAKFAPQHGAKTSREVRNGDVMVISDGKEQFGELVGQVEHGVFGVDGISLIHERSPVLKARRRLSREGVVFANLLFDDKMRLIDQPYLKLPGLLDDEDDVDMINELTNQIIDSLDKSYQSIAKSRDQELVASIVRTNIKQFLKEHLGKNPIIITDVRVFSK